MTEVMLNASMRNNLLSLQQTQRLQDRTQLRLSTGLKVNSAIDNPSSYYTATSLNNRASDLSSLLDTMSQGIQTIKAANEALETGTTILEQAKAVAEKASESSVEIIAKVHNEAELLAAVEKGGSGYIVIESDISLTNPIKLKDGQKLVGDNYFAGNNGSNRKLSFDFTGKSDNAIQAANNSIISNLDIDFIGDCVKTRAITANFVKNVTLSNLNITFDNENIETTGNINSAIQIYQTSGVSLEGKINIHTLKASNFGILSQISQQIDISAEINIKTEGEKSKGMVVEKSVVNINKGSKINIDTAFDDAFVLWPGNTMNIDHSELNIVSRQSTAITVGRGSTLNLFDSSVNAKGKVGIGVYGILSVKNSLSNIDATGRGFLIYSNYSGFEPASIDIDGGSRLNIKIDNSASVNTAFHIVSMVPNFSANLDIAKGAAININRNSDLDALWTFDEDYHFEITKKTDDTKDPFIAIYDFEGSAVKSAAEAFPEEELVIPDIAEKMSETFNGEVSFERNISGVTPYFETISQYDMLVNDASYKGVNLLQNNDLKINFNEDRTSKIEVKGVDASSEGLGIRSTKWDSQVDILNSVEELENAINQLRSFSAEFGNYYAIVTTREDFTENLINVLTEGADKLTLAEMNAESANMLALQTRQQLAINSLSLASQATQSVLKLF